jgi:hypothetical protein
VPRAALPKSTNDTLLIFDGDGGYCTTSVRRFERALAAIPYQSADLDPRGLGTACAADR